MQIKTTSELARITNVISTANLQQPVDAQMFNQYSWGRYDTEIYGGRCGYIKDVGMRGRVTIFLSGKMISTGAERITQSLEQLNQAKVLLLEAGLIRNIALQPKVQNIVATTDLGSRLDFSMLLSQISNYIYEPETFPGIIYRTANGPTALIFSSGKLVIAGSKSDRELQDTSKDLTMKLINFICN
jgi:transcription initiation factor TFIID TATA-box-binding protein